MTISRADYRVKDVGGKKVPNCGDEGSMSELADRLAIQDVMTRYAAGVDDRDMAQYRACFADDVEIVGFGSESVHGADVWVADVVQKLSVFGATQHMLGPQLVTLNGDKASARTDVQALHYMKDDPETTLTLWATYFTDLRRESAGWKISRHELVRRGTRIQKG
ncbi:MAG: nuclear transport factor 2 family protein [Proteobacteria bacterium]|jgi:ketosteroid isomerase-like protein|nr:nuclear transport factor 2 family protein [Pseudomonadota bacterium]